MIINTGITEVSICRNVCMYTIFPLDLLRLFSSTCYIYVTIHLSFNVLSDELTITMM